MRIIVALIAVLVGSVSHAALLGRAPLTAGGTDYQAYYDTGLDVTWMADANFARTTGSTAAGYFNYAGALAFVDDLNQGGYLGISMWRLPKALPIDGAAYNTLAADDGSTDIGWNQGAPGSAFPGSPASELAYLFFNTLGNQAETLPDGTDTHCDEPPAYPHLCLVNPGPFSNIENGYWTGNGPSTDIAFIYYLRLGRQHQSFKTEPHLAWGVTDGDPLIATVPIPPAVWLFGSALGVMGWMRRRQRETHDV